MAVFSGGWNLRGQTLMQEPLGGTKEPSMSLFLTTLLPGYTSPKHQHPGVVFIREMFFTNRQCALTGCFET
jgi:quercetin dioxygenase-like cupin family protein